MNPPWFETDLSSWVMPQARSPGVRLDLLSGGVSLPDTSAFAVPPNMSAYWRDGCRQSVTFYTIPRCVTMFNKGRMGVVGAPLAQGSATIPARTDRLAEA